MLNQVPWVHVRKIPGFRDAALEGDVACCYAELQVCSASPVTYTTVHQYPKRV